MKLTKPQISLLAFNLLLAGGFGVYYVKAANYEFLAYVGTIIFVTVVLFGTLKYSKFPTYILAGVSIWMLLHMSGGSIPAGDGVLYAYKIYPFFDGGGDFYILKYDQVVHAFLHGVIGLMFLHLMREVAGFKTHYALVTTIAVFATGGFSIVNEIVEFLVAVNVPGNGVGGYENTVLDLIFNLFGAATAITIYSLLTRKKNIQ